MESSITKRRIMKRVQNIMNTETISKFWIIIELSVCEQASNEVRVRTSGELIDSINNELGTQLWSQIKQNVKL
jgi:hypothetical protein